MQEVNGEQQQPQGIRVDQNRVMMKLQEQLSEMCIRVAGLEALYEQTRDERDALRQQIDELSHSISVSGSDDPASPKLSVYGEEASNDEA